MFHECVCVCVSKCLSVCRRTCLWSYVCNCVCVWWMCECMRLCKNAFFFLHSSMWVWKREREWTHKRQHPKWTTLLFPRSAHEKSSSQDYGNFRSRNSSVCFQTSFTLSKVKSIKHRHTHKHAHADKRVVSVTPVNRVSINLIVPT